MHYKAHRYRYTGKLDIPLSPPQIPPGVPGDVDSGSHRKGGWICHPGSFAIAPDNGNDIGIAIVSTKVKDRAWVKSLIAANMKAGLKRRHAREAAEDKVGGYASVSLIRAKIYPSDDGVCAGCLDLIGPERLVVPALRVLRERGLDEATLVPPPGVNQWVRAILAADLPVKAVDRVVGTLTRTSNERVIPVVVEYETLRSAIIRAHSPAGDYAVKIVAGPTWNVQIDIPSEALESIAAQEDLATYDYFARYIQPFLDLALAAGPERITVDLLEQQFEPQAKA